MSGIFKIKASFNLTNRGVVAYGHLVEGKGRVGSFFTVDIEGQPAKVIIKGTGMGREDEEGNMSWGLILDFEDSDLEKIAIINRIKEQTVQIYSDDSE